MDMRNQPIPVEQQLSELHKLVQAYPGVQEMLDLAADEADRRAMEKEASVRCAWRVSAAFGSIAVLAMAVAGGAVMTSMQPAPPPEVLVVERASGRVEPAISLKAFQMEPAEATIRRNIATFVAARERYIYENVDADYTTAAAFMSPQLKTQWIEYWQHPTDSPLARYKQHGKVKPTVGSITLLRNPAGAFISARVGFTKVEVVNGQQTGAPANYIATIPFHWVNQPTDEQTRRINDLGMEITDYVVDRDVGGPAQQQPPAAPAHAAQTQTSPVAVVAPTNGQRVWP
ncbi:type IV secretion system protein [Massilia sp. Leaf139]|uniref:type IV secretion system protein n=1 Tax=Massilia sp. Leaf139 TaxID=1736272 RepID=UPI0006FCA9EB|nr:type IV secretion system protein [Massilia sp. Leaf139]KQQ96111.1 hypothetical protein ASF77_21645 [Massilia sp. Leaf139]